jgi:hypothetical protein
LERLLTQRQATLTAPEDARDLAARYLERLGIPANDAKAAAAELRVTRGAALARLAPHFEARGRAILKTRMDQRLCSSGAPGEAWLILLDERSQPCELTVLTCSGPGGVQGDLSVEARESKGASRNTCKPDSAPLQMREWPACLKW